MGSRKQKNKKNALRPIFSNVNPKVTVVLFVLISIGMISAAWHLYFKEKRGVVPEPAETTSRNNAASKIESTVSTINFEPLIGRWVRPDGGYVIEIRNIRPNGEMDAAYFNPRSIHVAKAAAAQSGTNLTIFLELRDVGYPGSAYTLVYNPQKDLLLGIYDHAGIRQQFNVVFVRQR